MTGASWTAHDWYKTSMFFGCVAVLLFFSALSGLFANIGLPASAETQATVEVGCILLLLQRVEAMLEELTDFKRDYWQALKKLD